MPLDIVQLQRNPSVFAYLKKGPWFGWLLKVRSNGDIVPYRSMVQWEIEQALQQSETGLIYDNVRVH